MYPTKIWEYYLLWERRGEGILGTAAGIAKMLGKEQETDRSWLWGTTSFILGKGCPSWCSLSSDCQAIFSLHTMIHKIITSAQNFFFLNRGLLVITRSYWTLFSDIWTTRRLMCLDFARRWFKPTLHTWAHMNFWKESWDQTISSSHWLRPWRPVLEHIQLAQMAVWSVLVIVRT